MWTYTEIISNNYSAFITPRDAIAVLIGLGSILFVVAFMYISWSRRE